MSRHQKRKKNRAGRASIACIVIFLLAVMSIQILRLYDNNREYIAREKILTEQLENESERQQQIAEYEEYTKSKEYVEDTAKSKLGLVYENEIVFKEK